MRGLATATLATLLLVSACARPIHRRTFVFHIAGQAAYDHPAVVPVEALQLAIVGRVAAVDRDGMAQAMVRAFHTLRPDQVIYYRRPAGGAYLFGVRNGILVVTPYGQPGRMARYALTDLQRVAPPKAVERGEVTAIDGAQAELEIESAFGVTQYVFIGGTFVGTVPVGESRVFAEPPGRATIDLADAADGATNATRVRLDLARGQRYHLSVLPRL